MLVTCWGNECSLMFVSNCNENSVRGKRKSLKMSSDFSRDFFVTEISRNLDTPLRKPPTSCFGANTSNHKSVRTLDATASIDNNNNNNYDVNTTDWGAFWLLSSTDFSVLFQLLTSSQQLCNSMQSLCSSLSHAQPSQSYLCWEITWKTLHIWSTRSPYLSYFYSCQYILAIDTYISDICKLN